MWELGRVKRRITHISVLGESLIQRHRDFSVVSVWNSWFCVTCFMAWQHLVNYTQTYTFLSLFLVSAYIYIYIFIALSLFSFLSMRLICEVVAWRRKESVRLKKSAVSIVRSLRYNNYLTQCWNTELVIKLNLLRIYELQQCLLH